MVGATYGGQIYELRFSLSSSLSSELDSAHTPEAVFLTLLLSVCLSCGVELLQMKYSLFAS